MLKLDTLRRLYTIVVQNIRKAREKLPKKEEKPHQFKVNDMVLVKDPDAAVFEPRYQPNFRVTAIFGNNRIEVQDERGHKSVRRSAHVKYIAPSDKVIKQLPSEQVLKNYGRSSKLLIAEKDIPNVHFDITDTKEKGDSPERTDVMEIMDMNTESRDTHLQHSESREHSQNSRIKQVGIEEVTVSAEDTKRTAANSDFSKHSQNSLSKCEPKVDPGEAKVTFGDRDGRCLVTVSEFRELSPKSQGGDGRLRRHTKEASH